MSAGGEARSQATTQKTVNAQAATMVEFQERVEAYVALQQKLESSLPPLSDEATPKQIDGHQRSLAQLIRDARRGATRGEMFDADMQAVIRALTGQVFGGPDGASLKAELMDENPGRIRVAVNGRYPDAVPLSTVPPQLLAGLPELPDDMEYRFLGRALILFDARAHLIVDIMDNAIP